MNEHNNNYNNKLLINSLITSLLECQRPEVEITVRHQTIDDHLDCLPEQISLCSDILFLQKNKYDKKECNLKDCS